MKLSEQGKIIRIAAIGYGNRVRKYLSFIEMHPELAVLVAVVDSNPLRLMEAQQRFHIKEHLCFANIDKFFAQPLPIDAVIIGTPDDLHYMPCISAIKMGYHILLEKPIAQSLEECENILRYSTEKNVRVMVCYVLRYHPYYKRLRSILLGRQLGEIISVNHTINVGIDRTTHSYVRGLWNNTSQSNPIILSKCCHDIDLINWLTDSRPRYVSSFGSLKWFKSKNAPKGSSYRCIDCSCEKSCPFSAIDLYIRRGEWTSNFIVPSGSTLKDVLEKEMQNGNYGKCVYYCNNDVADHQVVSMLMDNNIAVNLTMDCFTMRDNRLTDIKCVYGEIIADDEKITVTDFRNKRVTNYDYTEINKMPLHANADLAIMEDFIASFNRPRGIDSPSLQSSIESHKACYAAEISRKEKRMVEI